ncbi:MAG: hypothetical protein ACHQVK_01445 [Candidatus Paceibacterales bacterium]
MLRIAIGLLTLYGLINGCKTVPYFKTSNDFYKQEVTLYLVDGKQMTGTTSFLFEEKIGAADDIEFKANGDTTVMNIPVKDIRAFTYKGDYFVPKYVDLFYSGVFHLLFLKRLTTAGSRLQFYELHQLYKSSDTGEERYFYFLSLPNHSRYEAWNIYSANLVPFFESKMSAIVDDCPALASKIKEKANGYYLPQFSFSDSKKVEVFKRIIDEYNHCK